MALRYQLEDGVPQKILDFLFLGSIGAALSRNTLKGLGITHVLTVGAGLKALWEDDFSYKLLAVMDDSNADISQFFEESYEFIESVEKKGGKALVHW